MLSRNVLYHGTEEPPAEPVALRAGPLTMDFEPAGGMLRYIRLGDREVWRGVYVAVRDRDWGTVAPVLSNLSVEQDDGRFRVTFDVSCREREIDYSWRGAIAGDARGTLTYTMDGVANATFLRNRIGFCLLHPAEVAGRRCRAETTDGAIAEGAFPEQIAPHQPFRELRALAHEVAPGVWGEARFAGDIFEMEDQRNWTDASYKTYCTPLRLPIPVEVRAGTSIGQSVTLSLRGEAAGVAAGTAERAGEVVVTVGEGAPVPLPRIGLGLASHGERLSREELARLRALNLAHLRVDLDLAGAGYRDTLERAADEARALGVALEVALHLGEVPERELAALASECEAVRPPVASWLLLPRGGVQATEELFVLARRQLGPLAPGAKVGSGTNLYFTHLNRDRPPAAALDLVCYSLNPQVHAFDDASLVETLPVQATTVASARRFTGDTPLAVTPVTLRPRFNADASGPEAPPAPGELPAAVDPRQLSLFGAGWTLGSLKHLAGSGVWSVTYYETTGWRGVMETARGSPLPARFPSSPGMVYPLYHVLADVGEFAGTGGVTLPVTSSDPLRAEGLALRNRDATTVLLANLGPRRQRVRLVDPDLGATVRVRALDETTFEAATRSPEAFRAEPGNPVEVVDGQLVLGLRPYAVLRVDTGA